MSTVIPLEDLDKARDAAIEALRNGDLVVVPTDTVYAVVADAFQPDATRKVARAKRRSRAVALPVVIRSPRQVTGLVSDVSDAAERLMASYWPGPLTLVFPAAEGLTWNLGLTRGTVSLRMPADDFLLSLIGEVGPLACTGANRREQALPTSADEAVGQLEDAVAVYVDGGERGQEGSTVVDVTGLEADVLREGTVPAVDIHAVATGVVPWGQRPPPGDVAPAGAAPEAPEAPADADAVEPARPPMDPAEPAGPPLDPVDAGDAGEDGDREWKD